MNIIGKQDLHDEFGLSQRVCNARFLKLRDVTVNGTKGGMNV